MPDGAALARREIKQLERMAVGIAELEGAYPAVLRRQSLWPAARNRLVPDPVQTHHRLVDVGHDDGEMLKPQVRAAAVGGIGAARPAILHELDLVVSEAHQQRVDDGALDAHEMRPGRVRDVATADRRET